MSSRRENPASVDALKWLRWLLAQGKSRGLGVNAQAEARYLGITKAQIARDLGVSPRAITHWLAPRGSHDFREMPDIVAANLDSLIDQRIDALRARREAFDEQDDIVSAQRHLRDYRPRDLPIPLRQYRYRRPRHIGGGQAEPSEIFSVDVQGLEREEIFEVLRYYHKTLAKDGRKWDVRFLARVLVEEYFPEGALKDDVASSIRGRQEMYILIPKSNSDRHFVYRFRGRLVPFNDVLASLRIMLARYEDRIRDIVSVSFIPYKPESRRAQKRKRATGK